MGINHIPINQSIKLVKNVDLWALLDRVVTSFRTKYKDTIKHIPVHVGILGNERADRLTKVAVKRTYEVVTWSEETRLDQNLESMTDVIVASILTSK